MRSPHISSFFCNTGLWTKNVSCHFSKPRMLQLLEPPTSAPCGDFRMKKDKILALDSEGAYQRNNFSEPRLLHLPIHRRGFLGSSAGKESACNAGEPSSIPGSGRSPREGIGYPLQYSWAFLVAQMVKNLPATQETWV